MEPTPDTQLTLTCGDWHLVTAPYGASLRGLYKIEAEGTRTEVITGYSGAKNKAGGQGDVLIPFPGRIAQGRYTFGSQSYQMDKNDKEGPNAIHGFLRQTLWQTEEASSEKIIFAATVQPETYPGYPYALSVRVTYHLSQNGLQTSFAVENTGSAPAPVAAGFHPYFTAGSALINTSTLQLPFSGYLEFDETLIPTGKILPVEGTPLDFRQPRPLGETVLNTCYAQPKRDTDGRLRIRLSDTQTGKSVTVWMDDAFDYVVLYSGDPLPESHRRRALAIEPMTCGADAFNHPEWGLVTLLPGEALSGNWGVTAE